MPALVPATRRAAILGGSSTLLLDTLSVQPAAAWMITDVLKKGKTSISGTAAALGTVTDQAGTRNATPVGFTAAAADQVNGKTYLNLDQVDDCLSFSALTLDDRCEIWEIVGPSSASSASTALGRDGFAGPYTRTAPTGCGFRNAAGTVGTITGGWTLPGGIHVIRKVIDGTNFTAYVDRVQWGQVAYNPGSGAGAIGSFDRIGKGQAGNFFKGALCGILVFSQVLGASDVEKLWSILMALVDAGTIFLVGENRSASNTAVSWNLSTGWKNAATISAASSTVALKNATLGIQYGATFTEPLMIQTANQDGTQALPNKIKMVGDPAAGPAVMDLGIHLTGATWTQDGATNRWYTTSTLTSYTRAWWQKAGMTPMAMLAAVRNAYNTTPFGTAVDFSVLDTYVKSLTVATSVASMTSFSSYLDDAADRFYVDLGGTNPNGQDIVMGNQNGRVTNRGFQFSRPDWKANVWMVIMYAAEDGTVQSGDRCEMNGLSAAMPLLVAFNSADGQGGKGGLDYVTSNAVFIGNGDGRSLSGSEGDGASAHGNSRGVVINCEFYMNDKAGMDDEWSAQMKYYNCIASGNNQNFMFLNQTSGSGAGYVEFHNCQGKAGTLDTKPMFQALASVAGPATMLIDGGTFGGPIPVSGENQGVHLDGTSKMAVTGINNPVFIGFTTVVDNDSTAGGTVTGIS